jgi:hypothetical protein
MAVINLSGRDLTVTLQGQAHHGSYLEYFDRSTVTFDGGSSTLELPAWGYRVFVPPASPR